MRSSDLGREHMMKAGFGARRARLSTSPARNDAGFSFVETVVTIVLLGMVVLPILAAVRGGIRASATSQAAAQVETVLLNAVSEIERASATVCDLSDLASTAAERQRWDRDRVTVVHESLDSTGWVQNATPQCAEIRRMTITVTSPDGDVSRQLQVVKTND